MSWLDEPDDQAVAANRAAQVERPLVVGLSVMLNSCSPSDGASGEVADLDEKHALVAWYEEYDGDCDVVDRDYLMPLAPRG